MKAFRNRNRRRKHQAASKDGDFAALDHADSFDSQFVPSTTSSTKASWLERFTCSSCEKEKERQQRVFPRRSYATNSEVEEGTFDVVEESLMVTNNARYTLSLDDKLSEDNALAKASSGAKPPSVTEDYSSSYMTDNSSETSGLHVEESQSEESAAPAPVAAEDTEDRIGIRPFQLPAAPEGDGDEEQVDYSSNVLLTLEENIISTEYDNGSSAGGAAPVSTSTSDSVEVVPYTAIKSESTSSEDPEAPAAMEIADASGEYEPEDLNDETTNAESEKPEGEEAVVRKREEEDENKHGIYGYSKLPFGGDKHQPLTDTDATITTAEDSADHSGESLNPADEPLLDVSASPKAHVLEPLAAESIEVGIEVEDGEGGRADELNITIDTEDAVLMSDDDGFTVEEDGEETRGEEIQADSIQASFAPTDEDDAEEESEPLVRVQRSPRVWPPVRPYPSETSQATFIGNHSSQPSYNQSDAQSRGVPRPQLAAQNVTPRRFAAWNQRPLVSQDRHGVPSGVTGVSDVERLSGPNSTTSSSVPSASSSKMLDLIHRFEKQGSEASTFSPPKPVAVMTPQRERMADPSPNAGWRKDNARAARKAGPVTSPTQTPTSSFFWRSHPQQTTSQPARVHSASSRDGGDKRSSDRTGFIDPLVLRRQEIARRQSENPGKPTWAR